MEPTSSRDDPARSRALRIYVAFAGAFVAFVLLASWAVEAREKAAARAHEHAVAASAADPGTPVTDPALPAGVVEVDLVPIHWDLPLEEPATLRAGARRAPWAPGAPARFDALTPARPAPLSVRGPYVAEAVALTAPTGARGARVSVRAVPLSPPGPPRDPPGMAPEKRLEIALRTPESISLTWKQGFVVIAEDLIPRASPAALGARITAAWKQQRNHFDVMDRRRDPAIARVGPGDSFEDIVYLSEALLSPQREMRADGVTRLIPAFRVSVQPPG
jgi:hypothetical protein